MAQAREAKTQWHALYALWEHTTQGEAFQHARCVFQELFKLLQENDMILTVMGALVENIPQEVECRRQQTAFHAQLDFIRLAQECSSLQIAPSAFLVNSVAD
jgi:hypothetical protein